MATPITNSCRLLNVDNLLLNHVGLPNVLVLAIHLVNLGWMGKRDHSKAFLQLALICWSTPSWLKVGGGNEQAAMW